ncbi:MAG TPA: 50S ribosomal protein L29 [Mizugakiibacter sp.]|nr:50S ribosomal protein L29 [Mizugakiibacter sp.]
MEVNEMRDKEPDTLQEHLHELRREIFNLRMQKGSGQLSQPHQLRRVRREIARTKMVLSETRKVEVSHE